MEAVVATLRDELGMSFRSIARYLGVSDSTVRSRYNGYARPGAPVTWDRESVLEAGHRWIKEHGEPPKAPVWDKGNNPGYPSATTVKRAFGKWADFQLELGYFRGKKIV